MARIEVPMPQMGESIAEGTVSQWLKQVGDAVERDEPILEISTDKVDAEIPSPSDGTLVEIAVQEGETVEVGTIVAFIDTEAGAATTAPAAAPAPEPAAAMEQAAPPPVAAPVAAAVPPPARARRTPSRSATMSTGFLPEPLAECVCSVYSPTPIREGGGLVSCWAGGVWIPSNMRAVGGAGGVGCAGSCGIPCCVGLAEAAGTLGPAAHSGLPVRAA